MTKQEAFDKAWEFITAQGKPAMRGSGFGGSCMYRSEGLSCAVGCLIPDEMAERWDDAREAAIDRIALQFPEDYEERFGDLLPGFLREVQRAHDNAGTGPAAEDFVSNFQARMRSVAGLHDLQVPA